MDAKTQALLERSFNFGVRVLRLLMRLPSNDALRVPKYQLAKAGTSVGANYEEAQGAESKRDFSHKIGISLKEARESHYWLRIIKAVLGDKSAESELDTLIQEAYELKNIFASIKISSSKEK